MDHAGYTGSSISVWLREYRYTRDDPILLNTDITSVKSSTTTYEQPTISNESQEDIIIAVVGKNGCGKSSFVSKLAVQDYADIAGYNPESETCSIWEMGCRVQGQRVLIIDTPGFGDTVGEDLTILERIADWLHHSYNDKKVLTGLIYMHDIGETETHRPPLNYFKLLREITGRENMANVILLTTKWDALGNSQNKGFQQESGLCETSNFWKAMIAAEATVMRHDGTAKSAEKVMSIILEKKYAIFQPQVQSAPHEMEGSTSISDTLTRRDKPTLETQFQEVIKELKETRKQQRNFEFATLCVVLAGVALMVRHRPR